MHPCCWGNLLQGLVALVPALAVLLIGGKKIFGMIKRSLPMLYPRTLQHTQSCCQQKKNPSDDEVIPVSISLGKAD